MCGFHRRRTDSREYDRQDSAMDTLEKRFARGEIDEEEYREKKWFLNLTQEPGQGSVGDYRY